MARINLNEADKYMGGGSFFKLDDGQKKNVRFLYNTVDDVLDSALLVHEFSGSKFATIDCSQDDCKWCAMNNNHVVRVVLPIYDEATGEIQYWKRSGSFVKETLVPLFENLPANAPISGQSFVISRSGKTLRDTKYSVAPDMRVMNDMKTKEQFGEVKNAYEMGIIKPNDCDFDPNEAPSQEPAQQATRRTADVF